MEIIRLLAARLSKALVVMMEGIRLSARRKPSRGDEGISQHAQQRQQRQQWQQRHAHNSGTRTTAASPAARDRARAFGRRFFFATLCVGRTTGRLAPSLLRFSSLFRPPRTMMSLGSAGRPVMSLGRSDRGLGTMSLGSSDRGLAMSLGSSERGLATSRGRSERCHSDRGRARSRNGLAVGRARAGPKRPR